MKGCTANGLAKLGMRRIIGADRTAGSVADMEPAARDEPLATQAIARRDRPARIVVTSCLRRIRDADGTSAKYIIDSLVDRGLLCGDGPETITEVAHRQVKADEDETVIEIYEATR